MAKCVIHIGMHKTGSTSIQHSLAALDDENHYYAQITGAPNHSVPVFSAFSASPLRHPINRARGYDEAGITEYAKRVRNDIHKSLEAAGERTLVISGEGIKKLKIAELERMKAFFDQRSADVEIVSYVRAPMGFISSAFQQHVKTGHLEHFRVDKLYPDYQDRFEKFDQVFGRDNVHLWKFDPASFADGSVVRDFCDRLGIDFSKIQEIRKNESISREIAGVLFAYGNWSKLNNKPGLTGGDAAKLTEMLSALPVTKLRLAPSLIAPIVESHQADIAWMEERLGQSLHEDNDEDRETDIAGEADLLKPVAGAASLLSDGLKAEGADVPEPVDEDPNSIILAYINSKMQLEGGRQRRRRQAGREMPQDVGERPLRRNRRQLAADADERPRRNRRQQQADDLDPHPRRNRRQAADNIEQRPRLTRRQQLGDELGERPRRNRRQATGELEQPSRPNRRQQLPGNLDERPRRNRRLEPGDLQQPVRPNRRAQQAADIDRPARLNRRQPAAVAGQRPRQAAAGRQQMGKLADLRPRQAGQAMRDKPAARARDKRPTTPRDPQLVRRAPKIFGNPITDGPRPMVNEDIKLTVLWSPKSACTTTYVWFAHVSGFSKDVHEYAAWPHRHREERYQLSPLYARSIHGDLTANRVLRIIRDPYGRAVSIYRHALQTPFAEKELAKFDGGRHDAARGFSFQTFLDMVAELDMPAVDIHFRPQFHPYEAERSPDVVINITKQDLFTELNRFEGDMGYPTTNFADLDWLKKLEHKRKAGQDEMEGDALDTMIFNRHQVSKLGQFPRYDQLLTPEAKQKIESIYKVDFDAYSAFL